jgi:hypothetical protein
MTSRGAFSARLADIALALTDTSGPEVACTAPESGRLKRVLRVPVRVAEASTRSRREAAEP